MKITAFGRAVDWGSKPSTATEKEISTAIFNLVGKATVRLSRPIITRLALAMRVAAIEEARELVLTAVDIINAGQGMTNGFVVNVRSLLPAQRSNVLNTSTGYQNLHWRPLNRDYEKRKSREYPNSNTIMVRTGRTRNYLESAATTLVEGRFGGVTIDIEDAVFRGNLSSHPETFTASQAKMILGHMRIRIFPKIDLMPGLSSREWTEMGSNPGNFERSLLPPDAAKKLGMNAAQRPLLLPLTQFWVLCRIPNTMGLVMQRYVKNYRQRTLRDF